MPVTHLMEESVTPTVRRSRSETLVSVWPVFLFLIASVFGTAAVALTPSADGRPVAAVFAPGLSWTETFQRAGGTGATVIARGGWDNVVVIRSPAPDLLRRLRRAGAWMIVDPMGFAACLGSSLLSRV